RRRGVEVEVVLLHVLAVIAFVARQAEEAFLQDWIASVPQREREAQLLPTIADAGEAVLVPAIRARSRVIVREIFPSVAVRAVVLADGAPRALAQIRAPALPVHLPRARVFESSFFRSHCCLTDADTDTPAPAVFMAPGVFG